MERSVGAGPVAFVTQFHNEPWGHPQGTCHAHDRLDRAVWAAYGWDDPDPATVDEETILSRLLALNVERAGAATS